MVYHYSFTVNNKGPSGIDDDKVYLTYLLTYFPVYVILFATFVNRHYLSNDVIFLNVTNSAQEPLISDSAMRCLPPLSFELVIGIAEKGMFNIAGYFCVINE